MPGKIVTDPAQQWIETIATYEREFKKWTAAQPSGCVIWIGTKVGKGYGQGSFGGKKMRAHRAAWIAANGAIPDGLHVLHRCDNPACVNAAHLFLGTNDDNVADKMAKGRHRAAWGERQGHAKLTNEQARAIRSDPRQQIVIANEYGVSKATVCMLKKGRTWAHL